MKKLFLSLLLILLSFDVIATSHNSEELYLKLNGSWKSWTMDATFYLDKKQGMYAGSSWKSKFFKTLKVVDENPDTGEVFLLSHGKNITIRFINDKKISFLEEGQFYSRSLKKISGLSESAKQALLDEQKHIVNAIKTVNILLEYGKFQEAYKIASKLEKHPELKLLANKAKKHKKIAHAIEKTKQLIEDGKFEKAYKIARKFEDNSELKILADHAKKQTDIADAIEKVNQLIEDGKFEEAYKIASQFENNLELKLLANKAKKQKKRVADAIEKANQLIESGKFEEAYNIASKFEKNAELKLLTYKAKLGIEQKVASIIEISKQDDIKTFPSVEIMMIKFNDYLIEDGSFKVIQNNPLHIQLSPKIFNSDPEDIIEAIINRGFLHGVYRSFAFTNIDNITITVVPIEGKLMERTSVPLYKKTLSKTLSITRTEALRIIQTYIDISKISELFTTNYQPIRVYQAKIIYNDSELAKFVKLNLKFQ